MSNRFGITLRFNVAEQETLQQLCMFYKRDPKDMLKFAFWMLAQNTQELQNKIAAQQKEAQATAEATPAQENETCDTSSTDSLPSPDSPSAPTQSDTVAV